MEDYSNKLKIMGELTLEMLFPSLCHRYETMLEGENFGLATIPKVRSLIRDSCQKLVNPSQSDVKISASSSSAGKRKLRSNKVMNVKKNKANENQELANKICDELVKRGMVSTSSKLSTTVQEIVTEKMSRSPISRQKLKARRKSSVNESSDDSSDDEGVADADILKSNPYIVRMIEDLKPELRSAIELCQALNAWIQVHVPKIEDGNNFGVEVQNQVIGEIQQLECDSSIFQKTMSLYFLQRAEIVTFVAKHPEILDFSRALEEVDTKQFMALRLIAREQRNSCYALLDMMKKNKEKLLKPRGASHSHSLVY